MRENETEAGDGDAPQGGEVEDHGAGDCTTFGMRPTRPNWNTGACRDCRLVDPCTRDSMLVMAAAAANNTGVIAHLIAQAQGTAPAPDNNRIVVMGGDPRKVIAPGPPH